ncbi:hypothetical protein K502DRAFT_354575 [Neoconidiobolus thromboides FSU 785]|nr:hypothetical protein K502DRAFT_354575 [Neoconidiobolus thromboides FSU 785]
MNNDDKININIEEKGPRGIFKRERRKILESIYKINPYPSKLTRKKLSEQLQMNPREFQIWFQNRRSVEKRTTNFIPINTGLQWKDEIKTSHFLKLPLASSPERNNNTLNFSPPLSSQENFESNYNSMSNSISSSPSSITNSTERMSLNYLLI